MDGLAYGHLVVGAHDVDGVPADELLLGYGAGAQGDPQSLVTFRSGELKALLSPAPYGGVAKTDPWGSWGSDSSLTSDLGWQCVSPGVVTQHQAGTDNNASTIYTTTTEQNWRWGSTGWTRVGTPVTTEHQPSSAITPAFGGWTGYGTFTREWLTKS